MSEVVQKRLELMTVELEEMQRVNLFTPLETRAVLKKRSEFEYKIHAITKDLKSFTDYIGYEKCLLKDVQLRRNKFKISDKRASIEEKIIKRIRVLYDIALQRFSDDTALFMSFLKFCKKVNYIKAASDAISVMLEKNSDKVEIWHAAANWHAYDRKDTRTAMIVLLKAVAIHKDSKILYKEMIRIELFEYDQKVTSDETLPKLEKSCVMKLQKIVTAILENIKDMDFYLELLEVLDDHCFTMKVQDVIIESLMKDYSDNANVWHVLAQREQKDYHVPVGSRAKIEGRGTGGTPRKTKQRLEACIAKYEQGLATVYGENKSKLWSLYINFLLKLQLEPHGTGTVFKLESLKTAFREMADNDSLSEDHYLAWMDILPKQEALEIAEEATEKFKQSLGIWKARLQLQIQKGKPPEVNKVFKLGINALQEKALPLWLSIVRYHLLMSDESRVESIYEDGVKQHKDISDTLKSQYIEHLTLTSGIKRAREVYLRLSKLQPYSKSLHVMMCKLESIQLHPNLEFWMDVHELACEQFGSEEVEVWINHIQFYLLYNERIPNSEDLIPQIKEKALQSLPQELAYLFETQYSNVVDAV